MHVSVSRCVGIELKNMKLSRWSRECDARLVCHLVANFTLSEIAGGIDGMASVFSTVTES